MLVEAQFSSRKYYDSLPESPHETGDIWTGIPTLGLLRQQTCSALVMSPACDLAHNKVDVVCVIPIVSVCQYFCLPPFYGVLRSSAIGLVRSVLGADCAAMVPKASMPDGPSLQRMKALVEERSAELTGKQHADKQLADLDRVRHFLRWIENAMGLSVAGDTTPDVKKIIPSSEWEKSRKEIVRNAFRDDIYFLPREREATPLPAVAEHSVALFRYPFAVPLCVLDQASVIPDQQWKAEIDTLSSRVPFAQHFRGCRPTKVLRLRPGFLHDLLTRYVRVYVRVGSPDFSDEASEILAAEIGS
jgi:hypothetical protein